MSRACCGNVSRLRFGANIPRTNIHVGVRKGVDDGEYVALKNDITQNGLLHPIVIFEGQVLDGRHRYSACVELGVPIITVVSDMRYRNEAQAIRHRGGVLIRIERPGVGPINDHISEHDLDGWTDWNATN